MDKKELHRRIIKSFIEPSLFYIPYKKNNDGLRIYTKYYNVYTKKVEEFDLVSKIIHTPAIKDEYGYVTHPNFKMDGYYVIYDELKNIVATSWHYAKRNGYVYMVNDGLYNTLDKVYPKGTYTIHEEVPPSNSFKQMKDFTLTLSVEGKLIDINKSIYREVLGYVVCGENQMPKWRLPYGVSSLPIDTGIKIPESKQYMYVGLTFVGGEIPFLEYDVRELSNGSTFKNISGAALQNEYSFAYEEQRPTYIIVSHSADANRYQLESFADEDGNLTESSVMFQTHRTPIITKDDVNYPEFGEYWWFWCSFRADHTTGDTIDEIPKAKELESAVNAYVLSGDPNDLQVWNGHELNWGCPTPDEINNKDSNKSLYGYSGYKVTPYSDDSGIYNTITENIEISFNEDDGTYVSYNYPITYSLTSVQTFYVPKSWEINDMDVSIHPYVYWIQDANQYHRGGMYTYYGYNCDTKSLLDNSMIDKELKENPILIT